MGAPLDRKGQAALSYSYRAPARASFFNQLLLHPRFNSDGHQLWCITNSENIQQKKEADPAKHGNCQCPFPRLCSATNVMTGLAFHATIFPPPPQWPICIQMTSPSPSESSQACSSHLLPCVEGIDIKAVPQQLSILKFAGNLSLTIPPYCR